MGLLRSGAEIKEAGDHYLPSPRGGALQCPASCRALRFEFKIFILNKGCILSPVLTAICFSPRFGNMRKASKPGKARERGEVVLKRVGTLLSNWLHVCVIIISSIFVQLVEGTPREPCPCNEQALLSSCPSELLIVAASLG